MVSMIGGNPLHGNNKILSKALAALPSDDWYERSFTSESLITRMEVSCSGYIVTADLNGIKVWRNSEGSISFEDDIRTRTPVKDISISSDGEYFSYITTSEPRCFLYTFNGGNTTLLELLYYPECLVLVPENEYARAKVCISNPVASTIEVYEIASQIRMHFVEVEHVIKCMKLNIAFHAIVAADDRSTLRYFNADTFTFPARLHIQREEDGDLNTVTSAAQRIHSLEISPDGTKFAVTCSDRFIRIFYFRSALLAYTLPEDIHNENSGNTTLHLMPGQRRPNVIFDESSKLILHASNEGILIRDGNTIIRHIKKAAECLLVRLGVGGLRERVLYVTDRKEKMLHLLSDRDPDPDPL